MRYALLLAAIAAPPAVLAAVSAASREPVALPLLVVAALTSVVLAATAEGRVRRRLKTVAAVLASYREGDFSLRARSTSRDGPVQDVLEELNQLGDVLRGHRLGELEAWTLLRKVMSEVDVVVLAVDEGGRVRLANEAAARVLARPVRELVGGQAAALGLEPLLGGEVPRVVTLGESLARWELRRGAFRLEGLSQQLVVLADVSRALRDSERDAWRRLIRVMGHEINNSLSPIMSIADSLKSLATAPERAPDWEEDLRDGLEVVARRAEALGRFMSSYATLARLPPPRRAPLSLLPLVQKVAALETRLAVEVVGGPDVTLRADADQLEQALINLVKNAAEASLGRPGAGVRLRWTHAAGELRLAIEDDGPGVDDTANLFVPFFTTKPGGSGVGLALSQQIIEAHEGQLSLTSREGGGAVALIRLPAIE